VVSPGGTFNDGQKEWLPGSVFENTEKGLSLVRGYTQEESIKGLDWGGSSLTVIYERNGEGLQVSGVDLSG
jgi:hypothetical protein